MNNWRYKTGLTLIELMVAVAILSVMIVGVGYVFTQTSGAVRLTQTHMEANAAVRAADRQIREDLRQLTKDGFLCIVGPGPGTPANGDELTPPVLLFTATGRFPSHTATAVVANAAIVAYMPVEDAAAGDDGGTILGRYAYLLTANGNPGAGDRLGVSLADIQAWNPADLLSDTGPIKPLFTTGFDQLNTAPATPPEVQALWPYLIGDCVNIEIEFYDGRDTDDYDLPAPSDEPLAWVTLQDAYDNNRWHGTRVTVGEDAATNAICVLWTAANKDVWPKALRVRLTMRRTVGGREETTPYEIIVNLPQ